MSDSTGKIKTLSERIFSIDQFHKVVVKWVVFSELSTSQHQIIIENSDMLELGIMWIKLASLREDLAIF